MEERNKRESRYLDIEIDNCSSGPSLLLIMETDQDIYSSFHIWKYETQTHPKRLTNEIHEN